MISLGQDLALLRRNIRILEKKNESEFFWFFREQFRFGHREVLLDYLNKDYSHLIMGFLQHGAGTSYLGDWKWQRQPKSFRTYFPVYVWSKIASDKALQKGFRHVFPIGSPWLYLLAKKGMFSLSTRSIEVPSLESSTKEFLFVPSHGSGLNFTNSSYSTLPKLCRKMIGNSTATVCLYYTEFLDLRIREFWQENGFDVTCNGIAWGTQRETVWTYSGSRHQYLTNILHLILKHRKVICLGPSTFAHYSISLNRPTSICLVEPEGVLNSLGIVSKGKGVERLRTLDSKASQILQSKEILGKNFEELGISDEKYSRSRIALGFEEVLSIESLEEVLTLTSNLVPMPQPYTNN